MGGWLVVWRRKSCLGLAEITSFVFLALFKNWGRRVRPRFHLFVSDVNQGIKYAEWVQDFLAWPQGWKDPPYMFYELLKSREYALEVECGVQRIRNRRLIKGEFYGCII